LIADGILLAFYCISRIIVFPQDRASTELGYQEIDCHINGDYSIGCRKEGDEVYVPFSFIHKYFEVSQLSRSIMTSCNVTLQ
jgi:hypothetical protein